MMLRDRRGPLAALVLATAYLLIAIEAMLQVTGARRADYSGFDSWLWLVVAFLLFCVLWRAAWRALFVAREYMAGAKPDSRSCGSRWPM